MEEGRRDEEGDARQQHHQPGAMNIAARSAVCKQLLGHSFELEAERDLRAEDQQARLVERRLQLRVDPHQK